MLGTSKVTKNVIVLDRGNYTTCTVHIDGGTILSWRVRNIEVLYIKEKTEFDHITPIRGGIKFTFPYFGRRIYGPKHGFSRYIPWKLEDGPRKLENGDIEATFCLEQSEYTKAMWNFKFKLSFTLTLGTSQLKILVRVKNTCRYFSFSFQLIRHSIFRTANILDCELIGLSKCRYLRLNTKNKGPHEPDLTQDTIKIRREYLDMFLGTPEVIEVKNLPKKGLTLKITADSAVDNVLIYNPWDESDKDVPEDSLHNTHEYFYCLGVGNGIYDNPVKLAPQESWESLQIIEIVDEEYDKKIGKFADLINDPFSLLSGYCVNTETYQ